MMKRRIKLKRMRSISPTESEISSNIVHQYGTVYEMHIKEVS